MARSDIRGGSRLHGIANPAAPQLQDDFAGPAEDHGEFADRRPRSHLDRRLRKTAGGVGLGEPGARIVARSGGGDRQAHSRELQTAWREVIGVVNDERDDGVNQKAPTMVLWPSLMDNFSGDPTFIQRGVTILIRTGRTGSSGFFGEVSRAVWSVNPNLPLASVRTLAEIYGKSLARVSFTLVMLAIAGGMALLLGVIGIYGVVSYSVSQRTREIGIRMALGSPQRDVTRLFVGHALRLTAMGIVCGLAAAAACTRLMSSLLFEVSPLDPLTFAGVPLMLVLAAALASYVPALRAAVVDPVVALRTD